ncbi:hypothetical protein N7453_005613 [Penicillium expansum]|nr:hypothetical protein N7453_005613 [Penicillium expansum]
MNEQAQWILQTTRPNIELPYHDTIAYDKRGHLVIPLVDVRVSAVLVFLVIENNIHPGKRGKCRNW